MTEYDTVLFDNDGVLVEPPGHETQSDAARAAFRELGVVDVDDRYVDTITNGATADELREICSVHDLDATAFWEARERLDEQSQLDAFREGVRDRYEDVAAIEDLSQRCGVVSNNHHSTVEFVLEFFGLTPLFETYYGREKTLESLQLAKPNTHYLDVALDNLDAGSALYVGDSESDVVAAHRAGMDSAFVRRSHRADVELSSAPTYEIRDLYELSEIA